jgi:hypothetical protein
MTPLQNAIPSGYSLANVYKGFAKSFCGVLADSKPKSANVLPARPANNAARVGAGNEYEYFKLQYSRIHEYYSHIYEKLVLYIFPILYN